MVHLPKLIVILKFSLHTHIVDFSKPWGLSGTELGLHDWGLTNEDVFSEQS